MVDEQRVAVLSVICRKDFRMAGRLGLVALLAVKNRIAEAGVFYDVQINFPETIYQKIAEKIGLGGTVAGGYPVIPVIVRQQRLAIMTENELIDVPIVEQLIGPARGGAFQFLDILRNGGRQLIFCFCRLVDAVRNPRNKGYGREQGAVVHA